MLRDFDAEIAAHEAAIGALRREQRAERFARRGILPAVRTAAEYGAQGGRAFVAKYGAGAMPRGGRRPNRTYEELMGITGGPAQAASVRPRRESVASGQGAPMG